MGNWRTVRLVGTLDDPGEVEALRAHLTPDQRYSNFGPLSITQGLAGLGDWPSRVIDVGGNLAERDYSVEDVADHLREIVTTVAPSLRLKIYCGGEWESSQCVITITAADGAVTFGEAEVDTVDGASERTMALRMLETLIRGSGCGPWVGSPRREHGNDSGC